ncbi:uncharacterized protein LOC130614516 [Hydractinia symbiolongicarpus]|uniref:uncharacterized protein LOC130614516 n=1 Tax=Hydractinia symbiolongicarpus TaxID=13093 RepID=UPI0025510A9B|nr:uncharacterized protein LOC130614516 [Hydractinia symbiolongicarpus]
MGTKAQKTESTENFISAWREEESLWNVTLTVYKNKDAKAKSTRILMGKCTMEEGDVKRKINTLRSYYSKELQKSIPKSGAGRDEIYESKWPYFQCMAFLLDTIIPRKTTSSLASVFLFAFYNILI